jgi:hypothetical protein
LLKSGKSIEDTNKLAKSKKGDTKETPTEAKKEPVAADAAAAPEEPKVEALAEGDAAAEA